MQIFGPKSSVQAGPTLSPQLQEPVKRSQPDLQNSQKITSPVPTIEEVNKSIKALTLPAPKFESTLPEEDKNPDVTQQLNLASQKANEIFEMLEKMAQNRAALSNQSLAIDIEVDPAQIRILEYNQQQREIKNQTEDTAEFKEFIRELLSKRPNATNVFADQKKEPVKVETEVKVEFTAEEETQILQEIQLTSQASKFTLEHDPAGAYAPDRKSKQVEDQILENPERKIDSESKFKPQTDKASVELVFVKSEDQNQQEKLIEETSQDSSVKTDKESRIIFKPAPQDQTLEEAIKFSSNAVIIESEANLEIEIQRANSVRTINARENEALNSDSENSFDVDASLNIPSNLKPVQLEDLRTVKRKFEESQSAQEITNERSMEISSPTPSDSQANSNVIANNTSPLEIQKKVIPEAISDLLF